MAIEGKIKNRDGKLYVVYATTLSTEAGNVTTGRVTAEKEATFVEESPVLPPTAGGKKLRWNSDRGEGRWEKLMASGWVAAGEGKASTPTTAKPKRKTKAQLDKEIAAALEGHREPDR